MQLNKFGQIVQQEWMNTEIVRPNVEIDEYAIMPNHMHGIVVINDRRGVLHTPKSDAIQFHSPSQTVGAILRGYKSTATKQINRIRQTPGQPVWQRNYYERVIRNENELFEARQYIQQNPLKWALDPEHIN